MGSAFGIIQYRPITGLVPVILAENQVACTIYILTLYWQNCTTASKFFLTKHNFMGKKCWYANEIKIIWLTVQSEVSHTHHHHPDLSRPILCQWPVNSPPHSPLKQTKLPNMIHMFVYYFTCYASMSYKNKLILCETYIHASSRMGFSPLLFCFVCS